ncbi:hypothetical protein LOD99_14746 [Oopsacas minuta]|uniref:UBA domain-containing protein n=1 Tax=Oopsacas minuta TaxID=111878 RepID=A0AAV7KDU3_9METZ|nr:hypothetical protein LOD99_14746 [Oopsacas minuta]
MSMEKPRFKVRAQLPDEESPHTFTIMPSVAFPMLHTHLKEISGLSQIIVTYQDEEGDDVTLTNEEEFTEAKRMLDLGNILSLRLTVTAGPNATPYKKEEPVITTTSRPQPTPRSAGKTKKTGYYPELAEELGEMLHVSTPKESVPVNRNTQTTPDLTNNKSEWTDSFLSTASKEITNVLDSLLKSVTAEPSSLMKTSSSSMCHTGILCKLCNKTIIGNRYKCGNCAEFDLCELCLLNPDAHDPTHILMLIRLPCPGAGYIDDEPVPMLRENIYQPNDNNEEKLFKQFYADKQANKKAKKALKLERKIKKMILPQHVEAKVGALQSDIELRRKEIKELRGKIRSTKKGVGVFSEDIALQEPSQDFSVRILRDTSECAVVLPMSRGSCKWLVENNGDSFWTSVRFHCVSGNLLTDERQISLPFCSQGDQIELEVPFTAPEIQGYYYSKWRLSHHGKAFGPSFKAECRVIFEHVLSDKNVEVDSGAEDDEDLASADQGFAIRAYPGAGGMQQPLIAISHEDYLEDNSLQALPREDTDSIDLDATELIQEHDRNSPLFSDSDHEFLHDAIDITPSSPPPTRLISNGDTASVASSSADSFIVVQMPDSFDPDKPMYLSQGNETIPAKIVPDATKEQIYEDSNDYSPLSSLELVSPSISPSAPPAFTTHSPQPNVSITSRSSVSPMSSIKSFVSSVVDKLDDSLTRSLTPKVQQKEELFSSCEDFSPIEFDFSQTTSMSSVTQEYTAPVDLTTPLSTSQTVNISPPIYEFNFDLPPSESFMVPNSDTTPCEAKPAVTEDTDLWLSQSSGAVCSKEQDPTKWIASNEAFPNLSLTSEEEAWIAPSANWKPKQPTTLLERLMKMGFCNRELNIKLLEEYNNELELVINALIEESQAPWVH